ncbi:hypothetical protein VPH35_011661 [Triticum aestivum]|uniref:uncharacterized protein n=1 Tax=Triticum aestivum TaxID=4565 RepID=UPI00084293F2|nr:uncharacterized protein LOC123100148 [Triticum aestivum]
MEEPSNRASSRPESLSDLFHAPLPEEWRGQIVKVAEYIPKVQGEPRRTLWRLNSSNMCKYQGPKGPAGVPLDPPADIVEATAPSSSEEAKADRCNARRKRMRSIHSDDMFKYRGCSWPQVVGLNVHKAKRIIMKGKPDLSCEVVLENQLMTMCYCSRRVRVIVDRHNKVVKTPRVG